MDEGGVMRKKHNPYVFVLLIIVFLLLSLVVALVGSMFVVAAFEGLTTGNWEFAIILGSCFGLPAIILTLYVLALNWETKQKAVND